MFGPGSSALSLKHDIEFSLREREVQAGTEPLGGIRSHLDFGSCLPEGERWGWEGSPASGVTWPGLGVLSFLSNLH